MYLEFIFVRENKKFTSWSLSEVVLGPVLGNQAYPDRRPGLRTQLRGLPAEGHLPPLSLPPLSLPTWKEGWLRRFKPL